MRTHLLPNDEPLTFLDPDGNWHDCAELEPPTDRQLLDLYRGMVIGRRFDAQATALVKQGRLAVYPSAHGQDACQVAAAQVLADQDWLFPTYRDSMAVVTRGVDPVEVLALLRGSWHCGYDPVAEKVAPQCTPLATNELHAVGLAHAAQLKHENTVALVLCGDGATSEGDTHEALNFAAVWQAPVVFLVQNNGYAISVPLDKQTAAPSLAHKGIGYGIPSYRVDGNDAAAVFSVLAKAITGARAGGGPTLIEAHTYRIQAHTNADDATRYRSAEEVEAWQHRDPITRLEKHLLETGLLSESEKAGVREDAERFAARVRAAMVEEPILDPDDLFRFVYQDTTPMLQRQLAGLHRELREIRDVA